MRGLKVSYVAAVVIAVGLVGCGETASDRALSGGGIGAGVGALGGALVGGNPLTGAVLGGAVGAATGAATDKDDVNFGKPAWKK